jgi:hypothetical protein
MRRLRAPFLFVGLQRLGEAHFHAACLQDPVKNARRGCGCRSDLVDGQSFRGTPLKDLHPPHVFQRSHADLSRAVSEPAIYRCWGKLFKVGDQVIEGERIILPLGSDGRHADGVLGASDFQYPVTTGPVELMRDQVEWFSI